MLLIVVLCLRGYEPQCSGQLSKQFEFEYDWSEAIGTSNHSHTGFLVDRFKVTTRHHGGNVGKDRVPGICTESFGFIPVRVKAIPSSTVEDLPLLVDVTLRAAVVVWILYRS